MKEIKRLSWGSAFLGKEISKEKKRKTEILEEACASQQWGVYESYDAESDLDIIRGKLDQLEYRRMKRWLGMALAEAGVGIGFLICYY
jgi:hypothetical protein